MDGGKVVDFIVRFATALVLMASLGVILLFAWNSFEAVQTINACVDPTPSDTGRTCLLNVSEGVPWVFTTTFGLLSGVSIAFLSKIKITNPGEGRNLLGGAVAGAEDKAGDKLIVVLAGLLTYFVIGFWLYIGAQSLLQTYQVNYPLEIMYTTGKLFLGGVVAAVGALLGVKST